jgi:hypothetical protein
VGANVTDLFIAGNYAYLSTAANSAEFTVVDISTPASPAVVASLDLGANQDALSVAVSSSYAYVGKVAAAGANREIYVVSIANPLAPSIAGSYELGSDASDVVVSGQYLYVATSNNAAELTVLNISTPAAPAAAGTYDASGNADGRSLFVVNTSTYLATANNSGSNPEFYILNTTVPGTPTLVGSLNIGGTVNGVAVTGTIALLATAMGNQELVSVNIGTPAVPVIAGSVDLDGDGNAVAVSGDYAFVCSINNNREVAIILGGDGRTIVAASGTLESAAFDASSTVAFNFLAFTQTSPTESSSSLQVAINTDNATWNYFGTDGTAATFFIASSSIPLAKIEGRYVRYKIFFAGDTTTSSVVYDVAINYSP